MQTLTRTNNNPELQFNQERRDYDDITTLMAEMMNGQMQTKFKYTPVGNELYAEDGGAVTPVFEDALTDIRRTARWKPELHFEVGRRITELDELGDTKAMARGELPNTMIVVSDSPLALKDAKEDIGGYNVKRKQTMLRVITRTEDGKIRMVSQSLDRSDRKALEEIYHYFGIEPEEGELLGQRIHVDLPHADQEFLADWLTGVYDRKLQEQYGGEWHAGRTPAERINTYDFVRKQDDLIQAYLRQRRAGGSEQDLKYGLAAALDKRFKRRLNPVLAETVVIQKSHQFAVAEMAGAGHEYRAQGKSFSGCGLTLDADDPLSLENQLKELGYSGEELCPEVKDGDVVNCPGCKKKVKAIVPNKETIFCSNPDCKLAHASVKG